MEVDVLFEGGDDRGIEGSMLMDVLWPEVVRFLRGAGMGWNVELLVGARRSSHDRIIDGRFISWSMGLGPYPNAGLLPGLTGICIGRGEKRLLICFKGRGEEFHLLVWGWLGFGRGGCYWFFKDNIISTSSSSDLAAAVRDTPGSPSLWASI